MMSYFNINNVSQDYPYGAIINYAGNLNVSTGLNGWLLCDGAAVSRTTYVNLFNAIGTVYSVGDGSTTFNIPNFLNRFAYGSSSNLPNLLNSNGGSANVTLDNNNLPAHTHSGTTDNINQNHSHYFTSRYQSNSNLFQGQQDGISYGMWGNNDAYINTSNQSANHYHSLGTTSSAYGNAAPFSILPPYTTMVFIIKY